MYECMKGGLYGGDWSIFFSFSFHALSVLEWWGGWAFTHSLSLSLCLLRFSLSGVKGWMSLFRREWSSAVYLPL